MGKRDICLNPMFVELAADIITQSYHLSYHVHPVQKIYPDGRNGLELEIDSIG